jgi:gluconolactonase
MPIVQPKSLFRLFLVVAALEALVLADSGRPGSVKKLDPDLDGIVSADTAVEKVAGGFKFLEGPIWVQPGMLLFSDIPARVIYKWFPGAKPVIFLGPQEFIGKDGAVSAEPGTNGLTLDKQGRLTICDQGNRRIVRINGNSSLTIIADRYQGKRFNSPNDLVYKSDGSLYFTDPPYALTKEDQDPRKEQIYNGVYRVMDGKVQMVVKDMTRPNGIAFSPDEKFLYVDNSEPRKVYMRFPVNPDGTLGAGTVFYDMSSAPGEGSPDGMKVDGNGNIYGTGPGGIWIISPQGKHLGTIHLPETAANCAWSGADGRTLYITATTGLYRIRLKVPGAGSPWRISAPVN